jgi:peptidyl-dipeptidase Dcp
LLSFPGTPVPGSGFFRPFRDWFTESKLLGTLPVVYNVANFSKPAAGQPALISFTDATTMFHEFGHALHGMFADSEYPSLSGTSVARDFVEFPSPVQ